MCKFFNLGWLTAASLILFVYFLWCVDGSPVSYDPTDNDINQPDNDIHLASNHDMNHIQEPTKQEGEFFPKLLSHIFDILNLQKVFSELKSGKSSHSMCFVCKFGMAVAQHFVETGKSEEEIASIAYTICTSLRLDSDRVCAGLISLLKSEMMYIFKQNSLGPQEVCGVLMGNECSKITSPLHNWTTALTPFPKPPVADVPKFKEGAPTLNVLHLSDTHLDPYYVVGSNADCKEIICCRSTSGLPQTSDQAAGPWGDYRNCDTPLRTLKHMLHHISKKHMQIDYVIWTGDISPHDIWNTTQKEQIRLLHYVSKLLRSYFPNTPIYPALGNHESARINSFPPPNVPGKFSINWLHEEVEKAWGHWLPHEARKTLKRGMYYSVLVKPGLRLISLNMNYCNNQNWWMILNSTDPGHELQWLVQQLQAAEWAGEKVHIVGHIPPGHSDCLPIWSANYYRIIDRFENTVTGQFFGHSHMDEFEVFYDVATTKRPIGIAYIAPSVTSYDSTNPSYRIYKIDGDHPQTTREVVDHDTYFMNLTEANLANRPVWRKAYSAKEEYGLKSLQPYEWNQLIERFQDNDQLFQKFMRNLYVLNQPIKELPCSGECKFETLCRLKSARSHDSSFCEGRQD